MDLVEVKGILALCGIGVSIEVPLGMTTNKQFYASGYEQVELQKYCPNAQIVNEYSSVPYTIDQTND